MNPKLKKVLKVLAAVTACVGAIYLAARVVAYGIAYYIAKALTNAAHATIDQATAANTPVPKSPAPSPADAYLMPLCIILLSLIVIGMFLLKKFEHTNKALKILGFVFIVTGMAGCLLGPFILAVLF